MIVKERKSGRGRRQKTERAMEEEDQPIPDRCPICRKRSNNVLLHIKKKDSCKEKIEPQLFDKWKNEANKRSKKKYQRKFVKSGKHKVVQKKYSDKSKKDDEESYLQVRRQVQAKYVNREKVQESSEDRLKEFNQLCIDILHSLREGRTPNERDLNRFHLVESDFTRSSRDKVYDWLKDVDGGLLISVIAFQKVCLIPRRTWLGALGRVECMHVDKRKWMKDQAEKLYKLIGQLASYRHPFNMVHLIPNEFKLKRKPEPTPTTWQRKPEAFSKEDEEELDRLILEILGDEEALANDEPMMNLLRITKDMDNLDIAMLYCKKIGK